MDKKKAMAWVKALRSGKFEQTTSRLRGETSEGQTAHCCLGVLAEISGCSQYDIENYEALEDHMQERCDIQDGVGTPTNVRILDKEHKPIRIRIGNKFESFRNLAQANDKGASFKSIATWIEKNYKLL
jgi:hypothetical protein